MLAALGIAIIVGGGVTRGGLYGDVIALTTVMFLGFYAVTLRRKPGVDMVPAVLYSGVFAAVVGGAVALATDTGLDAPARDIGLCVFLGVVQIGIGGILFAIAARTVPAAQLTLYALLEPVLQPLWDLARGRRGAGRRDIHRRRHHPGRGAPPGGRPRECGWRSRQVNRHCS